MMMIILKIGIFFLNIIYVFIKLFPIHKNKITLISRQSNEITLDFKLLIDELKKNKKLELVILCKRLDSGVLNKIKYGLYIFKLMYHIATSKVVVLDSYCIPICLLNHKKNLKVIQIWHALGSLKKFGYSSLDLEDGRSSKIAKVMKMHKNYDYILVSSQKCKKNFASAFGYQEDRMIVMSLPRVDYLLSKKAKENIIQKFISIYKICNNQKKNILYCPTHRLHKKYNLDKIIKAVDYKHYNLLIKLHGGNEYIYVDGKNVNKAKEINFLGLELLFVADYVITDYSAIIYEASILNKSIFLYAEDFNEYITSRGLYIDYYEEMPGPISNNIKEIMNLIESGKYDHMNSFAFAKKYIDDLNEGVSLKLVKFIIKQL